MISDRSYFSKQSRGLNRGFMLYVTFRSRVSPIHLNIFELFISKRYFFGYMEFYLLNGEFVAHGDIFACICLDISRSYFSQRIASRTYALGAVQKLRNV